MPTPAELGLTLATPTSFVDVDADINEELTRIATHLGVWQCTSSTRPLTNLFEGRQIRETDTRRNLMYVGGTWIDMTNALTIVGAVGTQAPFMAETTSTIGGNRLLSAKKNGEANNSFILDFDGKMQWGPGGATAPDVNLYRDGANRLRTDHALYASSPSRVPVPYFWGYQNAGQLIANITTTPLLWQVEAFDNINGHSTTTNTSRFTPTVQGWYDCVGFVTFGSMSGEFGGRFLKNGVVCLPANSAHGPYGKYNAGTAGPASYLAYTAHPHGFIYCNGVSDYIELGAMQSTGGNATTFNNADQFCFMKCKWISH